MPQTSSAACRCPWCLVPHQHQHQHQHQRLAGVPAQREMHHRQKNVRAAAQHLHHDLQQPISTRSPPMLAPAPPHRWGGASAAGGAGCSTTSAVAASRSYGDKCDDYAVTVRRSHDGEPVGGPSVQEKYRLPGLHTGGCMRPFNEQDRLLSERICGSQAGAAAPPGGKKLSLQHDADAPVRSLPKGAASAAEGSSSGGESEPRQRRRQTVSNPVCCASTGPPPNTTFSGCEDPTRQWAGLRRKNLPPNTTFVGCEDPTREWAGLRRKCDHHRRQQPDEGPMATTNVDLPTSSQSEQSSGSSGGGANSHWSQYFVRNAHSLQALVFSRATDGRPVAAPPTATTDAQATQDHAS